MIASEKARRAEYVRRLTQMGFGVVRVTEARDGSLRAFIAYCPWSLGDAEGPEAERNRKANVIEWNGGEFIVGRCGETDRSIYWYPLAPLEATTEGCSVRLKSGTWVKNVRKAGRGWVGTVAAVTGWSKTPITYAAGDDLAFKEAEVGAVVSEQALARRLAY